jgi:hypothetical protein
MKRNRAIIARRFSGGLVGAVWIAALSCTGATAPSPADADPGGEDAGLSDAQVESGNSMPCSGGPVTFQLSAGVGSSLYCVGAQGCAQISWLSITNARNEEVALSAGCRLPLCSDCVLRGCPLDCTLPRVLIPEGEQLIWDGSVWTSSTCGSRQLSCEAPTCAMPGRYVAKLCAHASAGWDAGMLSCPVTSTVPPTCVEMEFEYPTTSIVAAVLP